MIKLMMIIATFVMARITMSFPRTFDGLTILIPTTINNRIKVYMAGYI